MGPENRLIQAVSKLLPDTIYYEKMHNPYRGGTPDMWYSGPTADLWVEWKAQASMPRKGSKLVPKLSELQKVWLRDRYKEGRNVAVAVGIPQGVVIFRKPSEWQTGVQVTTGMIRTKIEVAKWIEAQCV